MKKLFLILTLMLSATYMMAGGVSYTHHIFQCDGGSYTYSIRYTDAGAAIVVGVQSENLSFPQDPVLMLKTTKGQVIRLEGYPVGTTSSQGAVLVGNVAVAVTELTAQAIFPVTEEQVWLLREGVIKVRINLMPCIHEREFRRDEIGQPIFADYIQQKQAYENF